MSVKVEDLTGKKFNSLLVLKRNGSKIYRGKRVSHHALWLCKCDCGNETSVITSKLKNNSTKSCGCHKNKNIKPRFGNKHPQWSGYKDISGSYFSQIQNSAKLRKKDFDISIEYIWEIYIKQNKKCAISGVDVNFCPSDTRRRSKLQNASVDRIDSSKGYIEGNIQILHKDVNYMKYKLDSDIFLEWIKIIYENNF